MKAVTAFFLLAAFCVSTGYAQQLESLTGTARASLLRSGENLTETQTNFPAHSSGAALKLLPGHDGLSRYVSSVISDLQPSIAVETLSLYKKPYSGVWTQGERAGLFNQILALSTLTGLEYYSTTRSAMRTLYEFSTVIDDPRTKKMTADPVFEQPPRQLSLYARQKDLSFGDNIYRYDYTVNDDAFFFLQENITSLSYGIVPAVGKNKLRTVLAVIDCGDSLLIYAVSMAKAVSVPGISGKVGDSFRTRAEAVLGWFTGRADIVYRSEKINK